MALSVYGRSERDVLVAGFAGRDDPLPLYVAGRSVRIATDSPDAVFGDLRSDALKCKRALGWIANEYVIDGAFNSLRHLGSTGFEGVMYPGQPRNRSEGNEDPSPAVRRTEGI